MRFHEDTIFVRQMDFCTAVNGNKKLYCEQMSVPGNWREHPGFREYSGNVCYRQTFSVTQQETEKHLELRFGGVFRRAGVWLNGERLGYHEGYQSAFHVNITGRAVPGKNLLEVMANNELSKNGLGNSPLFEITPLPIAGIYEPVTLEIS